MGIVLPSRVTVIQVLLIHTAILTNAAGIVHECVDTHPPMQYMNLAYLLQ